MGLKKLHNLDVIDHGTAVEAGGRRGKEDRKQNTLAARDGILGHQFNKRLLLLHAIRSPFYWRILKKAILFSGFKTRKL
jgi:hypothetical protein